MEVFYLEWFINLEQEEQEFIKVLLLNSGSLKDTAKEYGVSYPTIRLRLDRLLKKIKISEENKDIFEVNILNMVVDEEISLDTAKKIIILYKKNKEEL